VATAAHTGNASASRFARRLRRGGAVLIVGDVFAPGRCVAVLIDLDHRHVGHETVGGGTVPVVLAGLEEHAVAGADDLDRTAATTIIREGAAADREVAPAAPRSFRPPRALSPPVCERPRRARRGRTGPTASAELLGKLEVGAQLLAGGLVVDQTVQCCGQIEAVERKRLVRELVAGERELSVCDQPPPCDRGQRRTALLTGGLNVAALENQPGQAEPATGLVPAECGS
jgi:hypothetical protein